MKSQEIRTKIQNAKYERVRLADIAADIQKQAGQLSVLQSDDLKLQGIILALQGEHKAAVEEEKRGSRIEAAKTVQSDLNAKEAAKAAEVKK